MDPKERLKYAMQVHALEEENVNSTGSFWHKPQCLQTMDLVKRENFSKFAFRCFKMSRSQVKDCNRSHLCCSWILQNGYSNGSAQTLASLGAPLWWSGHISLYNVRKTFEEVLLTRFKM